jgi:hypothetical protein
VNPIVPDETFESETRSFVKQLASGATLAYSAGKGSCELILDSGTRTADRVVDDTAPQLLRRGLRAGVDALFEHGPREFRGKVVFNGR